MTQWLGRVSGPRQGLQKTNPQRRPYGQRLQPMQQPLHFHPLTQITAGDLVTQHFLAVFLQPSIVRFLMHPVHRRPSQPHQPGRHRLVGHQHEFLDQLMRGVILHFLNPQHPSLRIQPDLRLRKIQLQ
jgi:hypothetical protein